MKKNAGFPVMLSECFWCGETKNEILIGQRMVKDVDAVPRQVLRDYDPCNVCEQTLEQGIALIECTDLPKFEGQKPIQTTPQNLYPTRRFAVVIPDAIHRLVNDSHMAEKIIKMGKTFVDPEVFKVVLDAQQQFQEETTANG